MKYFALLTLLLAACSSIQPNDSPAFRMASSASVPHKHEFNGCYKYACELVPRLQKIGAFSYFITRDVPGNRHCIVVYTEDMDKIGYGGQWWGVDNEHTYPVKITGESDDDKFTSFLNRS